MHELRDVHDLLCLRAHLLAHAVEARATSLEISDADHILVGHPQRQVASDRGGQA
jgi:hypothetical protein